MNIRIVKMSKYIMKKIFTKFFFLIKGNYMKYTNEKYEFKEIVTLYFKFKSQLLTF